MRDRRAYWPHPGEAIEEAPDGATWPCGHPKTPANTQHIGKGGNRCRICRRKITREANRRKHKTRGRGDGPPEYQR